MLGEDAVSKTVAALRGCDAVVGGQFMRNSVEVALQAWALKPL
jgi:hypothetical protein